jgi:hypothetical protein
MSSLARTDEIAAAEKLGFHILERRGNGDVVIFGNQTEEIVLEYNEWNRSTHLLAWSVRFPNPLNPRYNVYLRGNDVTSLVHASRTIIGLPVVVPYPVQHGEVIILAPERISLLGDVFQWDEKVQPSRGGPVLLPQAEIVRTGTGELDFMARTLPDKADFKVSLRPGAWVSTRDGRIVQAKEQGTPDPADIAFFLLEEFSTTCKNLHKLIQGNYSVGYGPL